MTNEEGWAQEYKSNISLKTGLRRARPAFVSSLIALIGAPNPTSIMPTFHTN